MFIRLLLLGIFFTSPISASGAERYILDFKLNQGQKKIEWGKSFVTSKKYTWNKGLKRTYLKVRCEQQASGKTQKSLSLIDQFSGLRITHQLEGNEVKLTVVRDVVQPRLTEIRALGKDECREISPGVTTTSQSYSFPARPGTSEQRLFGEDMTFQITLQLIGASAKP
ncbi:MAG: hypothetical protein OQL06_05055 [Gammaproteobacteria bacterium]|nr:hypothetical protein [Gammaproteobacteria bacterium]